MSNGQRLETGIVVVIIGLLFLIFSLNFLISNTINATPGLLVTLLVIGVGLILSGVGIALDLFKT